MPSVMIMDRALREWGETAQLDMVIEEMAELTHAILKYKRAKTEKEAIECRSRIAEEEADVRIMLDQLSYILSEYDRIDLPSYSKQKREWTLSKVARIAKMLDRAEQDRVKEGQ